MTPIAFHRSPKASSMSGMKVDPLSSRSRTCQPTPSIPLPIWALRPADLLHPALGDIKRRNS